MIGKPSLVGRFVRWLRNPEIIGKEECPILRRWTLYARSENGGKLMVHHFPSNADDRDFHDHPWTFWTLVLWGGYWDVRPEAREWVGAPTVRRRPANHLHRTRAGRRGAWTIVVTGPVEREWGFWREGRWIPFKDYANRFADAMRCDPNDAEKLVDAAEQMNGLHLPYQEPRR